MLLLKNHGFATEKQWYWYGKTVVRLLPSLIIILMGEAVTAIVFFICQEQGFTGLAFDSGVASCFAMTLIVWLLRASQRL